MLTVVIAEQMHLDFIKEYDLFLHPFTEKSNAVFCCWNPQGETLSECVPDLKEAISRGSSWRAVIITDDCCREKKNPFDRVSHEDPLWDDNQEDEANFDARRQARFDSFKEACKQPLTRLTSYLGDFPTVTSIEDSFLHKEYLAEKKNAEKKAEEEAKKGGVTGKGSDNHEFGYFDSDEYRTYLEYKEYAQEAKYKIELKDQMCASETEDFFKPSEVICIARRTYSDPEYDIKNSWKSRQSFEYSDFANYNMYIPKLRFVIFDILPDGHKRYRFDYIRFLYAVLLLAGNELPQDSLHPERVYVLDCENDEKVLSDHLRKYDRKLIATQKNIRSQIRELKDYTPETLTDKEAKDLFCTDQHISMRFKKGFEEEPLYIESKRFGLFREFPESQEFVWKEELTRSRKTFSEFMTQPKKALSAACRDFHLQDEGDPDRVLNLDNHQVEEFRDYLDKKEINSVNERPLDFADTGKLQEELNESVKEVEKKLETRISRKGFWISFFMVILFYILSFVPFFVKEKFQFTGLYAAAGSVLLIIIIAFISLFAFRGSLRKHIRAYNNKMNAVSGRVHASMSQFSGYLSQLCSFMRANTADNALTEEINAVERQCRIYNKHIADIQNLREDFGLTFSEFLVKNEESGADDEAFDYDFRLAKNYEYPLVINRGVTTPVEYIQPDNKIELSVDFVKKVTLRMEELYD